MRGLYVMPTIMYVHHCAVVRLRCCVAAHTGGVRWVSHTEHRRAAPTRAAAVGAAHGGALHSPPRRQRVPGTSAAAGGTLCGQACRQPLPVHVCASGFMPRFWRLLAPSPPLALPCRPPLSWNGARSRPLVGSDRPCWAALDEASAMHGAAQPAGVPYMADVAS